MERGAMGRGASSEWEPSADEVDGPAGWQVVSPWPPRNPCSRNEGQITKTLRLTPARDYGYYLSLTVKNQGVQSRFDVPVSTGELRVIRTVMEVRHALLRRSGGGRFQGCAGSHAWLAWPCTTCAAKHDPLEPWLVATAVPGLDAPGNAAYSATHAQCSS